jgi:cellulose synthase operon protein C
LMATIAPPESVTSLAPRDRQILLGFAARLEPGDAGGHNNLGVLYFEKGLVEEAVEQFHLALEIDPAMPVARRNVEIAYLSSGYYERLARRLRSRLRAFPEDRDTRWSLARAHRHTGRFDRARAELHRLLSTAPRDARLLVELGRVEKEAGRFEPARAAYEVALAVDPGSAVLHFHLGELHYHQGNSEEARRVLLRAIELGPDLAEAHHLLSFVLGDLGEAERATEALERARQLGPWLAATEAGLSIDRHSPVRYVELLGEGRARPAALRDRFLAHYHLGVAFRQQGLYDEALREFERALESGEDRPLVLRARAELLLVAGRDREAVKLYRSLLEDDTQSPKLWSELGVCYHRLGDMERARMCYGRATEADPDYVIALNNAAVAQAAGGERAKARAVLERAVERRPAFTEALCNLGLLAMEEGRRADAMAAFRAAVRTEPHFAAGWLGIGAVLSETDEMLEARKALARAVELAPNSAEARYRLAFVLNRIGDVEASLRETSQALALNPYFTAPRLRLAIELQFEYAEVLAPEISTDIRLKPSHGVHGFSASSAEVADLFAGLRATREEPERPPPTDYSLAVDYLSKGLFVRALAEVRRAALNGGDPVEEALLAGEIFRSQGLEGEALERYDTALERLAGAAWSVGHARAWVGRGWCLLRLGRLEGALNAAETIRMVDPDHDEAAHLRADALLALGRTQAALEEFGRLRELRPNEPSLLMRMGTAARAAGQDEVARESWEGALRLDPDLLAVRVDLGTLFLDQGLIGEAIAHARTALDALPGYADAVMLLAEAELRRGDSSAAVSALADLLTEDPYHLPVLVRLGEVLLACGRPADATIAARRALRFDPQSVGARSLLAAIEAGTADASPARKSA